MICEEICRQTTSSIAKQWTCDIMYLHIIVKGRLFFYIVIADPDKCFYSLPRPTTSS